MEISKAIGAIYYCNLEGEVFQRDSNLCFSNGMALSPDGKNLFINEHRKNRTLRYTVQPDGTLTDKVIFFTPDNQCMLVPGFEYELGPDGMGSDCDGNLWIAHYGGGKIIQVSRDGF